VFSIATRSTMRASPGGPARCEQVNPGPELGGLELRGGKCAIDGQADLGQAGRSPSGFGVFNRAEELQPAGQVLVMR
jgi:hypothetical protein